MTDDEKMIERIVALQFITSIGNLYLILSIVLYEFDYCRRRVVIFPIEN